MGVNYDKGLILMNIQSTGKELTPTKWDIQSGVKYLNFRAKIKDVARYARKYGKMILFEN